MISNDKRYRAMLMGKQTEYSADPLAEILNKQGFVVLDGALATELERHGADLNDALWSAKILMEAPGLIRAVHADYLRAGADVITTASYQATLPGFLARGLSRENAIELLKLSVELAVDARDEFWAIDENRVGRIRPLVAASIGPYGAFLADGSEYKGMYNLTEDELIEFHRPRMEILAAADADLMAFETVPSIVEGRAILRLLAEFAGCRAWITFSCRDGHHVSSGELFADFVSLADRSEQILCHRR